MMIFIVCVAAQKRPGVPINAFQFVVKKDIEKAIEFKIKEAIDKRNKKTKEKNN